MNSKLKSLTVMGDKFKQNYISLEKDINASIKKTIYLANKNFINGTVIIAPEYYIWTNDSGTSVKVVGSTRNVQFMLTENIVFNPNSLSSSSPTALDIAKGSRVLKSQYALYPPDAYGLGFFCAISIHSNNNILNLNDFEIKQSAEHALQQRFYSNIELASIPFLPSQGPHTFGSKIKFANNCIIKNGILGRASHHSIHGNLATNIIIKNIIAYDYEIGVISLNGVRNIYIDNVRGEGHRHDIPVLGIFSTARFIWPFLEALDEEYQAVTITATSGQFKLSYNGATTDDIAFDATASDVQSALSLLPLTSEDVSPSSTIVSVVKTLNTYLITLGGTWTDNPPVITIVTGTTALVHTTASLLVATVMVKNKSRNTILKVGGATLTIDLIKASLEQDMLNVLTEVINPTTGEKRNNIVSNTLYKNIKQIPDGNSYGILINQIGVAVNGFPISRQEPSSNIYIINTIIKNHIGYINEIPAIENPTGGHEKDPVGSVFQTQNIDEGAKDVVTKKLSEGTTPTASDYESIQLTITTDGVYKGNAVSNAQLYITKAIQNNEQFFNGLCASETPCVSRNSISLRTLDWAEASVASVADIVLPATGAQIQYTNINYLFNSDSMFHVNKGLVTCKLDAIHGLYVENTVITKLHNRTIIYPHNTTSLIGWNPERRSTVNPSYTGTDPATEQSSAPVQVSRTHGVSELTSDQRNKYILYTNGLGKSNTSATYNGSGGHDIRGWSLSSSRNCLIKNCVTRNVKSELGKSIGYDIHQDSDNIYLINCSGYNIDGGVAIKTPTDLLELAKNRIMKLPKCIGFRAGPRVNYTVFQDCSIDGINETPIAGGQNSIEILSNTVVNIKT